MDISKPSDEARLFAVSDLHSSVGDNAFVLDRIQPRTADDWLIVAGDVAEHLADIARTLRVLAGRFAKVIWTPGNHELWTQPGDPVQLRGVARYQRLVEVCREAGVLTPEDEYLVWTGPGGPLRIAPLFVLYDYSFLPNGADDPARARADALATDIYFVDEHLLHPDPYPTREAWCAARLTVSEQRLVQADDPAVPLVLVNHFPLVQEPTRALWHRHLSLWCGTVGTADWHRRFNVAQVVYGHLHIPRITWHDGVPHHEVSVGYPREWRRHGHPHGLLRRIAPRETSLSGSTG
nr:metallophosphoesterase [Streptomyces sp. SCL15-6]